MSAPIDTDRLAASSELYDLAERFLIESTMWADTDAKRNLQRGARLLNQIARQALASSDLGVAQAYAEAASILIRNVEGARRFLLCIDTPPIVRRRGGHRD